MADDKILIGFALRTARSVGDACIVHMADGERLRLAAFHHRRAEATPLLGAWLGGLATRAVPGGTFPENVLRSNEALLVPAAGPDDFRAFGGGASELYLTHVGVESLVVVPVRLDGRAIGTVSLLRDRGGAPYGTADWVTVQELADALGRAVGRRADVAESPASESSADAPVPARSRERVRPESPSGDGRTILVVEDEESVRELVREVLAREGYTVLHAETAEKAVALLNGREGRLDLLLTDMVMPGMSGAALARTLRASHPGLSAVFMSGYVDEALAGRNADGSAAPFLQKPFTLDALITSVRAALAAGQ